MDRKTFLYNVTASVIATIVFLYALQPVSLATWRLITSASNSAFTSMQEKAVLNAALGKRDWVSACFLEWFASAALGLLIGYLIMPLFSRLLDKRVFKEEPPNLSKIRSLVKTCYWVFIIIPIVLAYSSSRLAFFAFADLQMNASFSQRLDAIAPYIDVQAEKQLRSRWARMETLSDYRGITADMDQLGAKAGIKLPKVLYR